MNYRHKTDFIVGCRLRREKTEQIVLDLHLRGLLIRVATAVLPFASLARISNERFRGGHTWLHMGVTALAVRETDCVDGR